MPADTSRPPVRGLYAIIDTSFVEPDDIEKAAQEVLEGGARIIQLRAKGEPPAGMLKAALILRKTASRYGCPFIVNDRADIALMSGADGVHLGQDDIPAKDARGLLGVKGMIGLSTHSLKEVRDAALTGADYISFGPIFATKTKKDAQSPKGVDALKEAVKISRLPIVAIGGITEENLPEVLKTGTASAALISEVLGAADIRRKAKEITAAMERFKA